jgi:hypothetical protein
VTGSLEQPEVLVVGRCRGKQLEVVGRTVSLKPAQAAAIAPLLKPATAGHPWPDKISTHWGKGSKTPIVKVRRDLAEPHSVSGFCEALRGVGGHHPKSSVN